MEREKILNSIRNNVEDAIDNLKKWVIAELKERNLDKVEHIALYSDYSAQYKYQVLKQEDLEVKNVYLDTKYFHDAFDTIIFNGFKIVSLWNGEESIKVLHYNVDTESVTENWIPNVEDFIECVELFNEWLKQYDDGRIKIL